MLKLGLAAIVVMAIVLWLIFKVRWRLLPLLAVLLGVLWSFSLLGLIGIDLSLVTIAGLPILIGLGIDFAIQVHNRIEEEVLLDHDEHPISETLANLAPPLIAATITGVAAFLALRISKVPMIRDFGVLLAVGIVILVIVGIIVPGSVLGVREHNRPTGGEPKGLWVEQVVVKLGSLPVKVAPIIALVGVGLFVGGVLVESDTKIESDPIKWISQDSDVVEDVERLEDETGFSTTLGILVQANNVYDQHVIDMIWDFTLDAEARDEVVTSSSLVNTMGKILMVPGATPIAPSETDIYDASAVMPEDIAQALVHFDGDVPTARAAQPAAGARQPGGAGGAGRGARGRSPAADRRPRHPRRQHPPRGPPARTGAGARSARRPRHGRHRSAREPVRQPRRAHVPGAQPRRPVPRAAHAQPGPGGAGAGAGVPRDRHLGARRLGAGHHAQPAHHGVGTARRRQRGRVLGADHGPPHRGTPGRARSGRRHPHGCAPDRPCLLHVGAHDHRRVRAC